MVLGAGGLLAAQGRARQGDDELDALLQQAASLQVRTGLCAFDAEGRTLAAQRADESFVPASNQKVLTALAVLQALGPEYRFRTGFVLRGGWLEVEAGGDPNWRSQSEHDPQRIFAAVAANLLEAGVTAIRGVRLLEGAFTGPNRPESWPQDQLDRVYCAPTGGLVLEEGCFRARVAPGPAGVAAIEVLAPRVPAPVEGVIKLAGKTRSGITFSLLEDHGNLKARGVLRAGSRPLEVAAAVGDPGLWFERALRTELVRAGVRIEADAPERDLAVGQHTTPLQLAVREALKDSSNFHAEQLLRVLGKERLQDGSFAGGLAALAKELALLLPHGESLPVLADGSGLSRENRVTPRLLAHLLLQALDKPYAGYVQESLPLGGVDGTLERRFAGPLHGRVRAKTGYIRGVSALSGYVQGSDGQTRVFAILMNWDPEQRNPIQAVKGIQQRLVECLAGKPGR